MTEKDRKVFVSAKPIPFDDIKELKLEPSLIEFEQYESQFVALDKVAAVDDFLSVPAKDIVVLNEERGLSRFIRHRRPFGHAAIAIEISKQHGGEAVPLECVRADVALHGLVRVELKPARGVARLEVGVQEDPSLASESQLVRADDFVHHRAKRPLRVRFDRRRAAGVPCSRPSGRSRRYRSWEPSFDDPRRKEPDVVVS